MPEPAFKRGDRVWINFGVPLGSSAGSNEAVLVPGRVTSSQGGDFYRITFRGTGGKLENRLFYSLRPRDEACAVLGEQDE